MNDSLDLSTVTDGQRSSHHDARVCVGLTVLVHPDPDRVGDRALLSSLDRGAGQEISRSEPDFSSTDGRRTKPLADRHVSREPSLRVVPGSTLRLVPDGRGFALDGEDVTEPVEVDPARLKRGVVITLAKRVALLLHEQTSPLGTARTEHALVGVSEAMLELRREIERVRDLEHPVLLQGETGTGKELVARAIHSSGARSKEPFVAVNMAALPPSLAAAELFGAARGAFTGADRARPGLIRQAHRGTLFLDEIGVMPAEVQALLLRFLEDHVVRSVGAESDQAVDVRVIAATDSDLRRSVEEGDFSRPLLERVAGYEIRMPPLRERPGDLGLLLHHFLRSELEKLGKSELLADPGPGEMPWLPAEIFPALVRHEWPGNVRELRNFALRLAVRHHDGSIPAEVAAALEPAAPEKVVAEDAAAEDGATGSAQKPKPATPTTDYRDPADVTDDELEDAMRHASWDVKRAAQRLGVARASLYKRIDEHPTLRTAAKLEAAEIERAMEAGFETLEELAERLQVSKSALKARMTALGIRRS